jgi:GT2 family glycosyltransferase
LYEQALAGAEATPELLVQYGHALKEAGRRDEAVDVYRRAALVLADPSDPLLHLAHLLKALGRVDEAGAAFKALLDYPALREDAEREIAGLAPALVSTADEDCETVVEKATTREIRGRAVSRRQPSARLLLEVLIDGSYYASVHTDAAAGGAFALRFDRRLMRNERHELTVRPAGAEGVTVRVERSGPRAPREPAPAPNLRRLTVIVPVFNAAQDLAACLHHLTLHTTGAARLLFIDDASTDAAVSDILAEAMALENVHVERNSSNLGFTRTVNRGLAWAGDDDVVILNSDTRVTPGWLDGLRLAAASDPRIGTVTPMSDRAGAFSAPEIGNENPLPEGVSEADFAVAFRRRAEGAYPTVPTGNGFCMFIRRAMLDEVGVLDDQAFSRGYGEENDLCMRALKAGWRHVVDDRTYVFHARSRSFGDERETLAGAGAAVLAARHPEYSTLIETFESGDAMRLARHRARLALQDVQRDRPRPRALFVISTQTGGTPKTNRDLMDAVRATWEPWLLECDSRTVSLSRLAGGKLVLVERRLLDEPVDPVTGASHDYDRFVGAWLRFHGFDAVHIRHLGWHARSLPRMARQAGAATVMSFHDFHALCPSLHLVDAEGAFCGGTCTQGEADCPPELWPAGSFPRLRNAWVGAWRARYEAMLQDCDAFVVTTQGVQDRIVRHLPALSVDRFNVAPHGRDFGRFSSLAAPKGEGEPLRILVPGNISETKGAGVIRALTAINLDRRLEFHVLGNAPSLTDGDGVVLHGSYKREQFAERARSIRPHVGAVLSICDETWCHTLTELWAVGLPTVVLNFPTVAGRVEQSGGGWVFDHADVQGLLNSIVGLGDDPAEVQAKRDAVLRWQKTTGRIGGTAAMAARYLAIYDAALSRRRGLAAAFPRRAAGG